MIFAIYVHDIEHESQIAEELLQISFLKKQPNKKKAKEWKRQLTRRDIQMTSKATKICSAS